MFACSGPFNVPIARPPEKVLKFVKVLEEYVFGIVDEEFTKYCAEVVEKRSVTDTKN